MSAELIAGGLRLAAGLFGKKSKAPTPSEMVIGAAEGARVGAEKWGFNPLTLLQAAGTNAAAGGGGSAAPLASLSILADIVEDKWGQDAKDRREYNRLQNELLTLEVERQRTLRNVATGPAASGGGAITGGRVGNQIGSFASSTFGAPGYRDISGIVPGRDQKVKPQEYGSGVLQYDNALTGPVTLFGDDGEPFLEYLQVPFAGGFQIMNNWAEKIAREKIVPWLKGDPDWKPDAKKRKKFVARDRFGRELPSPSY